MVVTILGSGTSVGVPVPCCDCKVCRSSDPHDQRLRASALVEVDGQTLLIDCGPDFRQQVLRANVRHIDAVLLTHLHYDHSGGIDDLRPYAYRHPLPLYTEQYVADILRDKYDYIFRHRYPGVASIDLCPITPGEPFRVGSVSVLPLRLMHGRLPIVGFRIGDFGYLTDCTEIGEEELQQLEGIRVLIIDALRFTPHPTHMNVEQALEIVARLHPGTTYFTHLSDGIGLHAAASQWLPDGVYLAYDGLRLEL